MLSSLTPVPTGAGRLSLSRHLCFQGRSCFTLAACSLQPGPAAQGRGPVYPLAHHLRLLKEEFVATTLAPADALGLGPPLTQLHFGKVEKKQSFIGC